MVCIPCLLIPLSMIVVVIYEFIKPYLQKMGIIKKSDPIAAKPTEAKESELSTTQ